MKLKKFEGRSLQEALARVRADLGEDAVVLQTFAPARTGFWRFFGRDRYVILAGKGFRVVPQGKEPAAAPGAELLRKIYGDAPPKLQTAPPAELAEIRKLIADLSHQMKHRDMAGTPEELFQGYVSLLNANVSEAVAKQIVGKIREKLPGDALRDRGVINGAIRAAVQDMIPVADSTPWRKGRARRVMLIGPTGVGKTTTIAKLAGNYAVKENREVALITLDTYRIAATDQLRRVAELLDVPMAVVNTPEQLRASVAEFSRKDVVLIDTAGRSQRDDQKMDELAPFVAAAHADELHLVCSLTTHPDTTIDQISRFGRFPVSHVILTKVDEAAKLGLVLDVLSRVKTGVSWVTTGQGIPQDIECARRDRLAEMILREAKTA
ncbi:MAG: flagellar biosynthesis protein FlhF [Candidatus Brocadiae bacterium]|nr:flagellar biosynthesis protein FlhF [Candidatus Brocadiia bacterium]